MSTNTQTTAANVANEVTTTATTEQTAQSTQTAQAAAEQTAQTAAPVQQTQAVAPAIPVTYDEIVAALKADTNNKVYNRIIRGVQFEAKTAKNGNEFTNCWITLDKAVHAAVKMPDGTHQIRGLGAIQMPYFGIELVMRRNEFYSRFTENIAEAIEAGVAGVYFNNIPVTIIAEFVPAGVQKSNPFSRKTNAYEVADYDRYVYHLVAMDKPTDPTTLGVYNKMLSFTIDDTFERIKAAREAKKRAAAEAASLANLAISASGSISDDIPF